MPDLWLRSQQRWAGLGRARFMNHPAPANSRYKPTCYEHAANCYTHALLIVPAIVGSALLHRLSDDRWEKITAWMYGVGLCALFIVSTVFHIVSWKKSHLRTMEHCFHMCDRMMIYIFIAASYAPWLNLRELGPLASHMRWFIWLMAAGGTIYVFLYHEKYKIVELFFYLAMGFSPALVVTSMSTWNQNIHIQKRLERLKRRKFRAISWCHTRNNNHQGITKQKPTPQKNNRPKGALQTGDLA
ncbi:monocyte to macrophage differentiation factor isoform X2 [Melanerpes formicivorus]|uniref:monocyte to macrophage differentiation factor isoform X2 n=1 Tax=Melanerpes formicivorus TaxID=211600 RepID=UPI00358E7860